jgi:hypothetical protein
MVGCDDPVRERVLHNASDRRVALLADESELYAEITSEEIQEARSEVLSVIRLLYERGSITTYFGSISTATASEGEWEEEEADESDAGSGEPEAPPSPAESRPKRRRGRLILGAICGSAAALAIVSLALMLGRGPAPRSRSQPVSASAAGPRGQVLMQSQPTEADSRAEAEEPKPSVAAVPRLSAGQALEVAEDAEAILEFPSPTGTTAAQVRVSGGSTVEGVGPSASDSTVAAGLYLRTGRITVTVLDEGFVVRTPLVSSLTGGRQTQYSVRVVLDATTTVFTRRGEVAVVRQGGELLPKLRQGEQVVLEPSGRMRLSR